MRRRSPGRSAGHRLRNNLRWTNDYYDDMAWLAIALERAGRLAGVERPKALDKLSEQFLNAWVPEDGGGIPWRKQDQFFNAPANGPAAIFLARHDRLRRAQQMSDWIDETLIDPETHLVFDGIKGGSMVRAQYTYCQGVVLGLETELAARTEDADHAKRVHRLVAAVRDNMAPDGRHQGRGRRRRRTVQRDPGAVPGARWPPRCRRTTPMTPRPRDTAGQAGAELRAGGVGQPPDRRRTCRCSPRSGTAPPKSPLPAGKDAEFVEGAVNASEIPERDLSVQLSGWMLMEAAHAVADDVTSESVPRIVRLPPTRLHRDPKAMKPGENAAAGLLLVFTVVAILWANSPWAESYWSLLDTHVGVTFGEHHFDLTVKHLINDGLMTFFFFIVGLEVTGEFAIGELTDRARAAVPVVAAIAGLAVPAVIFLLFNPSGENAQAWGVVISTDTAFLIGALAIIKPKFPGRLRIFLLTLAVVDDVGALIVIALFYSDAIQVGAAGGVGAAARRDRTGAVPAGRPAGPRTRCSGFALWVALYHGGHPSDARRCRGRTADPGVRARAQAGRRGRRGDPRVPAVTELAVRPRGHPPSARVDFDQRAPADRCRALRVVLGVAAVRVGQRRGAARRGEPDRGARGHR